MMEFWKGTVTPKDWAAVGAILILTVLLGVGFYFLIYSPQNDSLNQLVADNKEVAEKLAKAKETEKNIESLRKEAEKMDKLVTQFESRLPDTREIPTLLAQFEKLAGEVGLLVELSQLTRDIDAKKETIPYSVIARGSFHQITTFINRLEKFQRYLKVSELNIGEEKSGIAEASFRLSTYRFIQPSEEGKS